MSCLGDETVFGLLDGTLRNGERKAAEAHVRRCGRCRDAVDRLREMVSLPAGTRTSPSGCPVPSVWQSFVRGVGDAATLAEHLASCDRCLQQVAALQDEISVESGVRAVLPGPSHARRPRLARLTGPGLSPAAAIFLAAAAALLMAVVVIWSGRREIGSGGGAVRITEQTVDNQAAGAPEVAVQVSGPVKPAPSAEVPGPVPSPREIIPAPSPAPAPAVVAENPIAPPTPRVVEAAPDSSAPPRTPLSETAPPLTVEAPPVSTPSPAPEPASPASPVTSVVVARIERVWGSVRIEGVNGADAGEAAAGRDVATGHRVRTGGGRSHAAIVYVDGTRIEAGPSTALVFEAGAAKRVVLESGTLYADVSKQPRGLDMTLRTPQAEARVVGTHFELSCTGDATRVEVDEGLVQLTRLSDDRSARVRGGQYAVASAAAPPSAKPSAAGANVLVDPGFEANGREWERARAEGRSVVGQMARSGAKSLQIAAEGGDGLEVFQSPRIEAGRRYLAGGWIRTAGANAVRAVLTVAWVSAEGRVLDEWPVGIVTGARGWTYVCGRMTAPEGTARARVRLSAAAAAGARGGAWFDDIHLGLLK